jgi:hypothetical protein
MGDVADMILEGVLCQECGVYMEGGDGIPRTCAGCLREAKDSAPLAPSNTPATLDGRMVKISVPANTTIHCWICNRKVRAIGLKDHQRDAHALR